MFAGGGGILCILWPLCGISQTTISFTFLDKIDASSLLAIILGFHRRDFPLSAIERLSSLSHRLCEFHISISFWQKLFSTWPANYFRGLTHVSIRRQSADFSQRHSTPEFLDFLEGCPLPEDLIFFDTGPMRWENNDDRELSKDRIAAVYLWGVEYWSSDTSCDISNLVSAFAASVNRVTEWRLSFSKTDSRNLEYVIALVDGLLYTSVITAVLNGVRDVQILRIDKSTRSQHPQTPRIAWKPLFRCLPSVVELWLWNSSVDIVRALQPDGGLDIVCPLLRVLSIEGSPEASDIYRPHVNYLAERRSLRGSPIRRLRINYLCPETRHIGGDRRHRRAYDLSPGNSSGSSSYNSSPTLSLQFLTDNMFDEDSDKIIEAIAQVDILQE
ncbi:uncharacterized protein EV420DRAFT_1689965 [Desarmillaria tabescens]|uniref:F-box domain-containing protein n=1 Tax=Armillaria tabescens TaxID=1929756 RepID=A0AA39KCH9_ARMTA|nr:uncharacterized protein EV420DRAFT_1689965 [Desarmillaria tabescens]KAK0457299.1 hypothetical protein EV420DRAFT_1689965 [Desarmillaria tabescens]